MKTLKLKLQEFPPTTDGEEVIKRARAGSADKERAKFLLQHQKEIPESLRSRTLVFARTARKYGEYLMAPCLVWRGKKWNLRSLPFAYCFYQGYNLVLK